MSVPRIFVEAPLRASSTLELRELAARHVNRVLRLRAGQPLVLFDGHGGEYHGTIEQVSARGVRVQIGALDACDRESPLHVTLWQAICRGGRMDYVIEKATELGVSEIVPTFTQRSVVQLAGDRAEKRRAHWQAIARSACEQCGRNRVPEIAAPRSLGDSLRDPPQALRIVLDPPAPGRVASLPNRADRLVLVAGPEGGFDERERNALSEAGFDGVSLGPRVLRADTAALAALAALQSRWGDL